MGMSAGSGRAVPYINVTPFIDILLVLLIIFMVITPLKPTRFKALVPQEPPPTNVPLQPNPLTLVVTINPDQRLMLNADEIGTVDDPGPLAARLTQIFQERRANRAYRQGMETRADLPEEERIERTVFVKAPRSMRYGQVVQVIDALKGAGASPVGLQIDDLAN